MTLLATFLATLYLLVGSYGTADQQTIQVYTFDSGRCTYVSGLSGLSNPSFLYPSADGRYVYCVGEEDGLSSTASALSFADGQLRLLNTCFTNGGAPCNMTLSPAGHFAFTSNYFGGSVTQFPVLKKGILGKPRVITFQGHSVDPQRQDHPYLHAVNFTPDGRYLLADDLGTDQIHVIPMKKDKPQVDQKTDLFIKAGSGPRHLCWAPNGRYGYLIGELSGEVFTLSYADQQLTVKQCLLADSLKAGGSADIHCSHDGRFVYSSHRLKGDGISIMRVQEDGTLVKVGYQRTGLHPRNFTISPDDRYLLVACRDTNEVQVYLRDPSTGMLTDTGERIHMSRPTCLQWISLP